MARLLIAALLLLCTVVGPGAISNVRAQGIEQKMQEQFDVMANYTPPSVYMGARRGVISGGSMTIRTPVVSMRPFSLKGPSISIGCGGIDAYFGGFSFISKAALVQAMRSIVTAALTYAFQIALEAMCPTCADIMKTVQDWLNNVNAGLTNSCEATRNFMDDSGISNAIANTAKRWRVDSGSATDDYDAAAKGARKTAEAAAQQESGNTVYQELPAEGNQVWQILKRSAGASFGFSNDEFLEEIMSMTGTIIACSPKADEPEACAELGKMNGGSHVGQEGELTIWRKPAILTLTTLVEGGRSESKQYRCNEWTKCSSVEVTINPVQGMAQKIREAFLGTSDLAPGGDPGIIDKMTRYSLITTEPTDEEKKWMAVGGAFTAMLMRLAVSDPDAAKGFVRDNAEAIAAEIIVGYLDQWMLAARVAAGRTELKGIKEAVDMIEEGNKSAREDARKYYEMSMQRSQLYRTYAARIDPRVTN